MNEQDVKTICKFLVKYGNKPLSEFEKEFVITIIETAKSWSELFAALAYYANK